MGNIDWLGKVRALLDLAESEEKLGNAPAAATLRAKAEGLMAKFRIEEEELLAVDPTSVKPVRVDVVVCGYHSDYRQQYVNLYWAAAQHAGVRVAFEVSRKPGDGYKVYAYTVGYEGDVRYAEMIYTSARLVFAERLEPQVQQHLSDQENVYRLRGAGMERVRVAEEVWGNRDKANLAKVGRMYKAECAKRGEKPALDGRGVTGKVYREQYSEEFVYALRRRLRQAQDAAGRYGGGLVLHGRQERVDEAFYEIFPEYKPRPAVEQATPEECDACKRTTSKTGKCKDHRPYTPTAADRAAARRYYTPAAERGRQAGTEAARHVQLDRAGRDQVEDGGRGDVERVAFELGG